MVGLQTGFSKRLGLLTIVVLSTIGSAWGVRAQSISDPVIVPPPRNPGSPVQLAFRVSWGGGAAALWQGRCELDEGEIVDFHPLGVSVDTPIAFRLERGRFWIEPMVARAGDAVDLILESVEPESELTLTLVDATHGGTPITRRFSVQQLLDGMGDVELDATGNRLRIERVPGDAISVDFKRSHLIFVPGETIEFDLSAIYLPAEIAAESYPVEIRMLKSRTDQVVWTWRASEEIRDRRSSDAKSLAIPVTMPEEQGAYTLRIDLMARRGATPFVRPRVIATRSIDLMVVDGNTMLVPTAPAPPAPSNPFGGLPIPVPRRLVPSPREGVREWQVVHEIDPTTTSWLGKLQDLDGINLVKRFHSEPIGSHEKVTESFQGRNWLVLGPGQWYAFPLPIEQRERPHRIEVLAEGLGISADQLQMMGVSIIEPDAESWQGSVGHELGFVLPRPHGVSNEAPWLFNSTTAAFNFWPATRSPWVVVSNLSELESLRVGTIALSAGPAALDELGTEPSPHAAPDSRLTGPYIRKPELASLFGAARLDEGSGGLGAEDWVHFDTSIRRLIEHLRASGMNSVTITVAADGSAWYPSKTLQPSVRYDQGQLSLGGRDPIRKDLVELLLRRFDQAGLQVIPVLDLSAPLPAVERVRRSRRDPDLDQLDERGQNLLAIRMAAGNPTGYHDPTHDVVADAVVECVDEFLARYAQHPSLAGIGLRVGPGSHLFMAGASWGTSPTNLSRFASAIGSAPNAFQPTDCVQGALRESWLQWRASRMTALFARIETRVTSSDPRRKLYLLGEDWYQDASVIRSLHPTPRGREPDPATAPLEIGIAPAELLRLSGTQLVHGLGRSAQLAPSHRRLEDVLWNSRVSRSFGPAGSPTIARAVGDSGRQRDSGVVNASPSNSSPSNNSSTRRQADSRTVSRSDEYQLNLASPNALHIGRPDETVLLSGLLPVLTAGASRGDAMQNPRRVDLGPAARRLLAESLVDGDTVYLADESWANSAPSDAGLKSFLAVLSRLPRQPFATIGLPGETPSPVLVRTANHEGKTWFYLVNASPWPIEVTLNLQAIAKANLEVVGPSRVTESENVPGQFAVQVSMDAYDLAAFSIVDPQARLTQFSAPAPANAAVTLETELDRLLQQVNLLGAEKATQVAVDNSDFEQPLGSTGVNGWLLSSNDSQAMRVADAISGAHVLRMTSRGEVAWVRSRPLAMPVSGRLSLKVHVRNRNLAQQPALRLSLEAKSADGGYYQFAPVGLGHGEGIGSEIGAEWTPFAVHFDDLPYDGITELRVGFDLMGAGDVEIDGLQVLDGWFDEGDRKVLFQRISVARLQLQQGNVVGPYRLLESYWPRVILSGFQETLPLATDAAADPAAPRATRNVFDRVREFVPTPRPLR